MDDSKKYWVDFLNDRVKELKLGGSVRAVSPRYDIGGMTYVYDKDSQLVELGWSVEEAEASLREMAG